MTYLNFKDKLTLLLGSHWGPRHRSPLLLLQPSSAYFLFIFVLTSKLPKPLIWFHFWTAINLINLTLNITFFPGYSLQQFSTSKRIVWTT